MNITEAIQAFYEGKRTESLPLVVNDLVTVKQGKRSGAVASVISIGSMEPELKYLIEYDDGSSEDVALVHLDKKEEN